MYFLLTGLCGFSNHTYSLSYSGSTHRKIQVRRILKCHFVFQVMSEGKNSMCINQVFCTSIYFIFSVTCANPGISAVGLVTWAVPIISTLYDLMFMNWQETTMWWDKKTRYYRNFGRNIYIDLPALIKDTSQKYKNERLIANECIMRRMMITYLQ